MLMAQIQPKHPRTLAMAVSDSQGEIVKAAKSPKAKTELPVAVIAAATGSGPSLSQPVTQAGPSLSLSTTQTAMVIAPDVPLMATIETSTNIAVPDISLSVVKQIPQVDDDNLQALSMLVQVSGEKGQPSPMTAQAPTVMLRSGADNLPLPAIPLAEMPLPGENAGYLKVPFSKGEVIGQVIINKPTAEAPQQLLLSTNNADVSSLLRDSVQFLDEPRWRLTDYHEDKQDQGQRSSSEESDESAGDDSRRELVLQKAKV
ncbi:hypothetical protein SAMN05660489_05814 [Pseudomonas sp. LAMO17WK12:I10]|nr:hypothetical protein H160_05808 [Pseudomonas sp. LAMO17WK12:I9]SNY51884.1 hypothetical protein SAMN05660489_05814 [Pseudomonas sp. LAMO17WK12:I10]